MAWKTTVADYKDGYFFTMAPLAVKGKIILGTSGPGEMGPRGFIAAFDADSGQGAVADLYDSGGRGTWCGYVGR